MVVPKKPKIPDPIIPPFEPEPIRDEPLGMLYINSPIFSFHLNRNTNIIDYNANKYYSTYNIYPIHSNVRFHIRKQICIIE